MVFLEGAPFLLAASSLQKREHAVAADIAATQKLVYQEVGAFQGEGSFLVVGECQLLLLAEMDLQKRQTQAKFSKHDKEISFVGVERESSVLGDVLRLSMFWASCSSQLM